MSRSGQGKGRPDLLNADTSYRQAGNHQAAHPSGVSCSLSGITKLLNAHMQMGHPGDQQAAECLHAKLLATVESAVRNTAWAVGSICCTEQGRALPHLLEHKLLTTVILLRLGMLPVSLRCRAAGPCQHMLGLCQGLMLPALHS